MSKAELMIFMAACTGVGALMFVVGLIALNHGLIFVGGVLTILAGVISLQLM